MVDDERVPDDVHGSGPAEVITVNRRERCWLIDGLMVLMAGMTRAPENDLSELPEIQALLERLLGLAAVSEPCTPSAGR